MKTGPLVKKVKARLKTLERGGLKVQGVTISIDKPAAAKIAEAGNIALDAKQIARLQKLLRDYARYFQVDIAQRSSRKTNARLDALVNQLKALIDTFDFVKFGTVQMTENFDFSDTISWLVQGIFLKASVGAPRFKRQLAALCAACKEMRNQNSAPGHRPIFYLPALMNSLASIFIAAGGRSTKIQRGMSPNRQSKFIDFAWAAMQLLPETMRHLSKPALASWWEKHRPKDTQSP
jgi:hypothetical protein